MITVRTATLLGAATIVGAVPVALGVDPWTVVLAIVAVVAPVLFVDRALAANPRAVWVSRAGDRTVRMGQTAELELMLHNTTDSVARLLLRDSWVPSAGPAESTYSLTMRPGQRMAIATSLTPTRRGDRPAVRVTVRSYGPLRLTYWQVDQRPDWTLRVLPRFESRKHLPEKLAKLRIVEGAIAVRGRGQGTEFDTLREYVPGDDVRSIDWRATARRSDVMLRTWRPERSRRVVCVLDTGRTSAVKVVSGTQEEPRLDAAMEAALLLAAVAQAAGDQVDLLAADSHVRTAVSGVHGRSLLPRLVNALAPLQPALVETDFELITSEVLRRERKRSLIVIFTALEPGALGEGLLPVLPKLVARHQVLVAAVHDSALAELAATPIDTADAVYSAAAGTRALMERNLVAAALSRNGVSVLDSPAEEFASRVTDAYLALKAAGRL